MTTNASQNQVASTPPTQALPAQETVYPPVEIGEYDNHDLDRTGAKNRGMTRDRFIRVGLAAVIALFLVVTSLSGVLLKSRSEDYWTSWVWWLPVAVIVLPLMIGLLRRRPAKRILWALIVSVLAAIVLFLALLLVVSSGLGDNWHAAVFGNETMDSLGWVKSFEALGWFWLFAIIGWLLVNLAVLMLMTAALVLLYWTIQLLSFDEYFSALWSIVFAACAGLACIFPIGQSIIMNAGM